MAESTHVLLPHGCQQLLASWGRLAGTLEYVPFARELCIRGTDGATWKLDYCPFCGCRWPESLRDEYFRRCDEYPEDPDDDGWWRSDPGISVVEAVPVVQREESHPRRVRAISEAEGRAVRAVLEGLSGGLGVEPLLPGRMAVARIDGVDAEVLQSVEPHRSAPGVTGWVVGEASPDAVNATVVAAIRVVDGVVTRFWFADGGRELARADSLPEKWVSAWEPDEPGS